MASEQLYGLTASDVAKLRTLIASTDSILRAAGTSRGGPSRASNLQPFCMARAEAPVAKGEVGKFVLLNGDHQEADATAGSFVDAKAVTRSVSADEIVQLALTASSKWYVLGGGGGEIRLARFAGAWTNDPLMNANVKNVMLYRKVIPADPLVPEDPNEWEPDLDGEGFPIVVQAVNLLAWAGSAQQDVLKWCYVTKASSASKFWIMIGAEC